MSSPRDEARSFTRGAFVLLALSVLRYGGDVVARSGATPDLESEAVLDSLAGRTLAAVEDEERRRRPIAVGETLDPNRADGAELDRLPGVGPSTAGAIVAARESGMVFRSPADMLGVRGIGPSTLERMVPHLDFTRAPRGRSAPTRPKSPTSARNQISSVATLVDVNSADSGLLETLPGIGPALAARIVAERERRAFATLDDLARVRGIGAASVGRLRGLAVAGRTP